MTNGTLKFKLRRTAQLVTVVVIGLGFASCGKSFSEYVGISKRSPDETLVTTNSPLTVPPDYALRPPSDAPKADQPVLVTQTRQDGPQPIAPLPSQIERQKALKERAASQAAQQRSPAPQPITTASTDQHANAPTAHGHPTSANQHANAPIALGQPTPTQQSQPRKRITQAEYEEKIVQARRDDLARRKAKNPNYGTWRNIWGAIWD
jgi:hypothetical protein